MPHISPIKKSHAHHGFTLVEVLFIAPIVILAISGFVALMITMIGDSLATRDDNNLTFETQDALERIEDDTRLTTQFLTTTNTLPSPQGSDANFTGTAAFTNTSNTLLMGGLTTTKNPVDTSRQLVFYANQPNDCGSLQNYNRPFQQKIIYFINNGSLWRRAVVPNYNTTTPVNDSTVCAAPWQQNTCSPGYTASRCQRNDTEVMKNISSFSVKYLSSPSSDVDLGTSQALSANAIEVSITGQKTVKGRTVTSSGTIRGTKLNNIDVDLPLPNAPTVTGSATGASATFSWALVPNATSYIITYNINGTGTTKVTVDNRTTSYKINANRNDTVSVSIQSSNSTGTSASAGTAAVTIPAWYDCAFYTSPTPVWQNYGGGYSTIGYTKTSDDVVMLKGMIKGGYTTPDTPICKLPAEYAPSKRLQFQNASNDTTGRLDVWPNGDVVFNTGSSGWYSLDGANFVANTASYSFTSIPLIPVASGGGGWANFGNNFYDASSTLDGTGRVHTVGLIKGGAYTNDTPVAQLPAGQWPAQYQHFPARGPGFNYMGIRQNGNINAKGIGPNDWYSIQSMFYPSGFGGWTEMLPSLGSGWSNFDTTGSYPKASYTKAADGIVTLKGLIKNGTSSGINAIYQLPPGYRPKEKLLIHIIANGGYGRIDIDTDGKIYGVNTSSSWTSLDDVSFMGDQ